MIDRATIDRIMDAADIVQVITDYGVTLRKRGVNYVGLCPFHNERTPSFSVSPAKALCKCFSCGKGGNVVHFVMEYENISYPEALRVLARKYGIEIDEREQTDEERQAENEREAMFVANTYARDYFVKTLHDTSEGIALGMAYFRQRGFRDDTIRKFQLGYCTESHDDFARTATAKGYSRDVLVKTGLCIAHDNGRLTDRFRGRVMFPVHTMSGKVVAFGGRVLKTDAKTAKYQNSPESDIYHKSRELYGLYFAKRAIQAADRCYLVEGYTDVIQMHQSGIENVVASSGTSLTLGQIALVRRLTYNITVLYDGDSAGIKASLRGIDLLLEEGMNVKVVLLPDGEDPDSFARTHTTAQLRDYITAHEADFIRFKADILLRGTDDDPAKKAAAIDSIVASISLIREPIKRSIYIKETAGRMAMSEELLNDAVNKKIRITAETLRKQKAHAEAGVDGDSTDTTPHDDAHRGQPESRDTLQEIERLITQMVVRYAAQTVTTLHDDEDGTDTTVRTAEYVSWDLANDDMHFASPLHRRILDEAMQHIDDEGFDSAHYFVTHPDADISQFASDALSERYRLSRYHTRFQTVPTDIERLGRIIPQLMMDYKNEIVRERMEGLLKQLQDPAVMADTTRCNDIMQQYKQLKEVQKAIGKELGERIILPN